MRKPWTYTEALVTQFIGEWGFAGLKIDGQHLNGVPPCFNPAHHHARPEESVEGLQNFYQAIYQAAMQGQSRRRDGIVSLRDGVFGVQFPLHESGARLRS